MGAKALLVDRMIEEIKAGKYKAHDKLPSENELADQYKVPRIVVRKAYERLQELGYIFSKQGKGSYVQNQKLQIPLILTGDVSFTEKMQEMGFDFETRNIFCEEIAYDAAIFHSLKASHQDVVFKIGRLRIVDGCPIAVHVSYVKKSVFGDIEQTGRSITSMFQYYRSKGHTGLGPTQTQLSVVFPNEEERNLLRCSSLIPLLLLESGCVVKKTGTVLEHSKIIYRSDCFTYVI
ncbi:GntR family transcriptional regulator [Mesobacillus foraminis]|uniref:GntR family transcriptional regulator n=1 Tax=Mesobacillus foraminis TaxID=279826 RepID=UPI001BE7D459|nr:GntR family transcriptional regulator [Mesobacillus foraminis]MBT2758013.1 GntR family transcriptional regulator [Mesobacillus foraminis]